VLILVLFLWRLILIFSGPARLAPLLGALVMSFNLITLFSTFAEAPRATQHLKKLRCTLINIPGVVIHHAHNFIIHLDSQATAAYRCLTEMRYQIVFTVTGIPPPG
jgi:hypothetical protein